MVVQMICECGMLVQGNSEKHLKTNLKSHKRGKKHKEQLEAKKMLAGLN